MASNLNQTKEKIYNQYGSKKNMETALNFKKYN